MADEAALRREFPRLKAALTRAVNSKDEAKVRAEVARAYARFDQIGYPDDWARWQRALDDVEFAARRRA